MTISQKISNDPDSGNHGDWATDAFTEHVAVWVGTDGSTYCANASTTDGTFVTTGPLSPEAGVPLSPGIAGTFTGGENYVLPSSLALNPAYSTSTPQSITLPDSATAGFSWWVNQVFPSVATSDGSSYVDRYSLTYVTPHNGTWTDADAVSGGDVGDIANVEDLTTNTGYATISAAVAGANPGDTIYAGPGTYSENVTIDKQLTLEGAQMGVAASPTSARSAAVAGTDFSAESKIAGTVTISASGVTLDGFTIDTDGNHFGVDLAGNYANYTIENNVIRDNGYGILLNGTDGSTASTISGNAIVDNNKSTEGHGISAQSQTNDLTISDNYFSGNWNAGGNSESVNFYGSIGNTWQHSDITIKNNVADDSSFVFGSLSGLTMTGNDIEMADTHDSSAVFIAGNVQNATFTGNTLLGTSRDFFIAPDDFKIPTTSSDFTFTGNKLLGANTGIEVDSADSRYTGVFPATGNWWGSGTGPTDGVSGDGSVPDTNPGGTGSAAIGAVAYGNWCLNAGCTVTVTIDKFIDGAAASTTAATASFPMVSSWTNAPSSGGGSYVLGPTGFNSPVKYEAVTSQMDSGSSYTTHEDTSGAVVGPSCADGTPYALVGYTTGSTFADAAAATPGLTVPSFADLTQNEHVIVWNETCVPSVSTNAATGVMFDDATLNGTNGPVNATGHSFWVSTSTINTSSPTIPAGVYSTPNMGAISANASFSASLSSLTASGVPSHMPAVTPNTTYYYVAWSYVGGKWYHGAVMSFTTPAPPNVTTDAASSLTVTGGTLNGTNGPTAADNTSFWWGTTAIGSLTAMSNPASEFPASGWTHDHGLGSAAPGAGFSEPLTGLATSTTYQYVAWSHIGGVWYPGAVMSFATLAPPRVVTEPATSVTTSDATLNGTNGPSDATGHSFWVSTSPINTSSPSIPSGVYSTPDMGAIASSTPFSASLSSLTTSGVPSHMPAVTPDTTYYYVAWSRVGGTWYPGTVLSFKTATPVVPTLVITAPAANGDYATSTYAFTAQYDHGVTTSFDWAIRSGSSCSSGTVAGNVDGFHDANTFAAGLFTATLDTTKWADGTYCFIVNDLHRARATRTFVVDNTPPAAPTLVSPANMAVVNGASLTQAWSDSDPTVDHYIYASYNDAAAASLRYQSTYTTTSKTATNVADTTFWWRVRAVDAAGNESPWSDLWKLTVDNSVPASNTKGYLILVKHTSNSGVGTFSFGVSGGAYSSTVPLTTGIDGAATSSVIALDPGTYNVTEATSSDWILNNATCDSGSPSSITSGESVTIATGVTTTCTFTDEPMTTDSLTVYQGDLATSTSDAISNTSKWAFVDDQAAGYDVNDSLGAFVNGPIPAPLGEGSAQISIAGKSDGVILGTFAFAGTPLKDVTALSYATYRSFGDPDPALALQFDINTNGTSFPSPYEGRLVYEPYFTQTVNTDAWQTWNTLTSGANWWFSHNNIATGGATAADCSQASPCTWSEVLAKYPNIGIGGVTAFKAGSGWNAFTGNVDDFQMTVNDGSHATTTVTDFEPDSGTATAITNVSPEPSIVNQPYTVSWSVTNTNGGATPTGTVSVTVDGGPGCSAAASAGSCEITPTTAGTVTLVANFTGDPGFDSSSSSGTPVTHQIENAPVVHSSVIFGSNGPIAGGGTGGSGGQVLGASTSTVPTSGTGSCSALVTSYLGQGHQNDPSQVKGLQTFLNSEDNAGLPVTGFYGPLTAAAVSSFQLEYWQQILAPWVPYGLPTDHTPTGFVGKTTQWKINMLYCPSLDLPEPQVP